MDVTFAVSVVTPDKTVKNYIRKVSRNDRWYDVFDMCTETLDLPQRYYDDFEKLVVIDVSSSSTKTEVFHPDPYDIISTLTDFDKKLKYVTFKFSSTEETSTATGTHNAFSVLMQQGGALKNAKKKESNSLRFTAKDKLYNDVCTHMWASECKFPASMLEETVKKYVDIVTNAMWYLDGNKEKINERANHSANVKPLPDRFLQNFNDYNDWKKKRKRAPNLDSKDLKMHSGLIFKLISSSFTEQWGGFKSDLEKLAISIDSYAEFLNHELGMQQKRHALDHPVRQVGNSCTLESRPSCDTISPKYSILDGILSMREIYQYILFDEASHVAEEFKDYNEKYFFFQKLQLSVPIDILRYSPGGPGGNVVMLWRTPVDRSEKELMNMSLRVVENVKPLLPEYHTRQMKSTFVNKFQNLPVKLAPAMLRFIYSELTLDASVDQNPALDERIRQAVISDDTDLVTDLRSLNKGRPNDTFQVFFQHLAQKVEALSAADERRHNVEHLSQFISIKDLIKQVETDLPDNTPVPSESTVLFSFVPKNSHRNAAKLYKSHIPLQFKIQTRQLRSSHQDDHYCAAQFKYIRQYAIKYKENVTFLCVDDKAKVDFGEPGSAISTGVRGKKSLVPVTSTLSALDHDLQSKGSITPSVCLNICIPENIESSFYRGRVTVTYKDSVFQPSSPFRHGIEIQHTLQRDHAVVPPILIIFSDGGPDHRITYHSVKLALIILFKRLDIDILIAGRTAPGNSWLNPAERIMSVLNLGLQNVALMREESTSEIEMTLKGANSMADIRKKAERIRGLKASWVESVQPIIHTLETRTKRLSLKDNLFQVQAAATDEEVQLFEEQLKQVVDGTITLGQYQEKHLKSKLDYKQFLSDHCRERQYTFQIRKCNDATCCTPWRSDTQFPWVPDPELLPSDNSHYAKFEDLVGKDTTEKDKPSGLNTRASVVAEKLQGIRNAGLIAQNVRAVVTCSECEKPRCVYSTRKLGARELRSFTRMLEKYDYSCGSQIVPEGHILEGVVSVRLQMDCATPVEFPFYADKNAVNVRKDTCCHCAAVGAERNTELLTKYHVVLPVCQQCVQSGKQAPKRSLRK